ncbi:13373_t:CDS:1 [Ambispora gerdemannii]|uniref:13373_t:CDS:1 n=1 Tax=Ambispora gerdemannii TaxID=144530 RepID=A0A9N8VM58_9GLOM|nr:13373_t:CDS:1 [Ambispora gerdemannii]
MKFNKITFTILSLIGLVSAAVTTPSGKPPGSGQSSLNGYPPMDQTPPTNQPWFRKVDLSKVPNISPRKNFQDCPPKGAADPNCVWSCSQCQSKDDVYFCPNQGDWGLTFDDGPASSQTGKLLTLLDSAKLKATFFIVGSRVVEFPDTLMKTYKAGHHIAAHTWSHTPLTTLTNEQIVAEMLWTEKIINDTLGIVTKYMRPPQGDVDNRVRAVMKALGYIVVLWDYDTGDFLAAPGNKFDPNWIINNVTQWVKTPPNGVDHGHCSLEHDIHTISVNVIPTVLPMIQNAGFKPQPISTCFGDKNPYQSLLGGSSGGNSTSSSSGNGNSGSSDSSSNASGSESSNDPTVNTKSTSDGSSLRVSAYLSFVAFLVGLLSL